MVLSHGRGFLNNQKHYNLRKGDALNSQVCVQQRAGHSLIWTEGILWFPQNFGIGMNVLRLLKESVISITIPAQQALDSE